MISLAPDTFSVHLCTCKLKENIVYFTRLSSYIFVRYDMGAATSHQRYGPAVQTLQYLKKILNEKIAKNWTQFIKLLMHPYEISNLNFLLFSPSLSHEHSFQKPTFRAKPQGVLKNLRTSTSKNTLLQGQRKNKISVLYFNFILKVR